MHFLCISLFFLMYFFAEVFSNAYSQTRGNITTFRKSVRCCGLATAAGEAEIDNFNTWSLYTANPTSTSDIRCRKAKKCIPTVSTVLHLFYVALVLNACTCHTFIWSTV